MYRFELFLVGLLILTTNFIGCTQAQPMKEFQLLEFSITPELLDSTVSLSNYKVTIVVPRGAILLPDSVR
ncbi:MAG: hypothetical protein OEM52_04815 [bacterium]|nr:hypothetical protein [bacterium]